MWAFWGAELGTPQPEAAALQLRLDLLPNADHSFPTKGVNAVLERHRHPEKHHGRKQLCQHQQAVRGLHGHVHGHVLAQDSYSFHLGWSEHNRYVSPCLNGTDLQLNPRPPRASRCLPAMR